MLSDRMIHFAALMHPTGDTPMLRYQDFVPKMVKPAAFLSPPVVQRPRRSETGVAPG